MLTFVRNLAIMRARNKGPQRMISSDDCTRREYVDLSHVAPEHADIDQRLSRWGKWHDRHHESRQQHAMWRLYRSTEAAQMYGAPTAEPMDIQDIARIQAGVAALPALHRSATQWCYVKRRNPAKAAADMGTTLTGLALLISDGRAMLVSRGV